MREELTQAPACITHQTMRDTKSIIRLYVTHDLTAGAALALDKDQAHYVSTVMRRAPGDRLLLFNGRDGEWRGEITAVEKRSVSLQVIEQTRLQVAEPDVWLVFAPIKRARLDFIAQKATELGASVLQPIFTRRTIVDRVKGERMAANAVEAAEQCERLTVPVCNEPLTLQALLADWPSDRRILFCDEALDGKPAHEALQGQQKGPWAIFIGPEGGFDDTERDLIKSQPGTLTVSLGPRLLRADTAAMAALTLFQSALGDWR